MQKDLISVIVTTYNRSQYLKETLNSIQNQTYDCFEILVVDDGSKPEEALLNKALCNTFEKCVYYFKENTGQPDSRNYGIHKSKGHFIAFCDDDDLWSLDKLEKQLVILKHYPDFGLVTGNIEYIDASGMKTGVIKSHSGYNHGYIFENILVKNRVSSPTPLIRRAVFNKVGYFNPDFTIAEDWEFWRRVAYYYKFYSMNEVIAYVRLHPESMSKTRSGEVVEAYLLYRKLTKSLLAWGKERFLKKDINLIYAIEWQTYRKMLSNHYRGIYRKLGFLWVIIRTNFKNGVHLIWLYFRYELKPLILKKQSY